MLASLAVDPEAPEKPAEPGTPMLESLESGARRPELPRSVTECSGSGGSPETRPQPKNPMATAAGRKRRSAHLRPWLRSKVKGPGIVGSAMAVDRQVAAVPPTPPRDRGYAALSAAASVVRVGSCSSRDE